jgi:hypothetical protein
MPDARGERYPPFELCLTWDSQARAALQQGRKLFILDSCFARKDLKWPAAYESVARSACERQKTSGRRLASGTRFRRIDDQNRGDHFNLTAADECYFLREYTSGKNYKFGETNNLISNLKKKPSQSGTRGYRYKTSAIEQCAREISAGGLSLEWLRIGTLVPVPPSKARGHPDYDDRIAQICRAIRTDPPISIDVRELVVQTKSLDAAHEITGSHPTVDDLLKVYLLTRHLLILYREPLRRRRCPDRRNPFCRDEANFQSTLRRYSGGWHFHRASGVSGSIRCGGRRSSSPASFPGRSGSVQASS